MKRRNKSFKYIMSSFLIFAICNILVTGCSKSPTGPSVGSIQVSSTPTGANIFLDGNDVGQITPFTLTGIATGTHTLRLTLANYQDRTQTVTVNKNQTSYVDANLALKRGSLFISSSPSGAGIWLDDNYTNKSTPDTLKDIDVGQHTIALHLDSYYIWTDTVEVLADTLIIVSASLEKGSKIYVVGQKGFSGSASHIYYSEDGGVSWKPLNDQEITYLVWLSTITFGNSSDLIFVGTNAMVGRPAAYKSTNGGSSWVDISSGFGSDFCRKVSSIVCDPLDPNILYASLSQASVGDTCAGDAGYVLKSTNQGGSWFRISSGLPLYGFTGPLNTAVYCLAIDPTNTLNLFAGVWDIGSGLYRSTNGGNSWQEVISGLPTTGTSVFHIAFDPISPNNIYLVSEYNGVFKSTNGGADWSQVYVGSGFRSLAVDPTTPTTIYAGCVGKIIKSQDGGASWSEHSAGAYTMDGLVIDPLSTDKIFSISGYDLWKSTNAGITWIKVTLPPFQEFTIWSMAIP